MELKHDYTLSPMIGAGNYGIVLQTNPHTVCKLFKDTTDSTALKKEANIQEQAFQLFQTTLSSVKIPRITHVSNTILKLHQTSYLCGIEMTYVDPPKGYTTQVHTVLGYHGSDLDTVWGMRTAYPVSPTNPPRGFFASPYTLEDIWEDEGSHMTIETLAYQMGKAHRLMLTHGILPIDLEWVWSNGSLWAIDFGLCEFGNVEPYEFLTRETHMGLKTDLYVPHEGDRGYEEFIEGYCSS